MIVIAGKIKAKVQDWDEAQRQIDTIVAAVEAEAGCNAYRIYVDPADRNTFFLFEEWESADALASHRTQHDDAVRQRSEVGRGGIRARPL